MTLRTAILLLSFPALIGACASPEPRSFASKMSRDVSNAAYTASYNGAGRTSPGPARVWTPSTFATEGSWPEGLAYGDTVEQGGCTSEAGLYACDSDGDGLADSWGNAATGAYASARLRVNPYGEAFSWDDACACWTRDPARDGKRSPDMITAAQQP